MTLRPALRRLAALALAAALAACTAVTDHGGTQYVNQGSPPQRGSLVAVLPFENLATQPEAGLIASEMATNALYETGAFAILEASEARRRMVLAKLDPQRLGQDFEAARAAEAAGVDAVLVGSVTEFRYQSGLKEEPTVGFTARLVRADGTVLWAGSRSGVGAGMFRRESLNETAGRVARAMVGDLAASAR